jgi:hypothetical protein
MQLSAAGYRLATIPAEMKIPRLRAVQGAFAQEPRKNGALGSAAVSQKTRKAGQPVEAFTLLMFRYTFKTVKRILAVLLLIFIVASLGSAEETSFRRVRMLNLKGKRIKAVLTFSDNDKAAEVQPAKGAAVTVPFSQIDKASYEFTEVIGAKTHWLQIYYHEQESHKLLVLVMEKRDYLHILDALKAHAGIDAEILGNADKVQGADRRQR